mgnify:CR=1 FL=1
MKKLTVMLLIAAMVLGVSACGNSANKENTATESQMSTQEAEDLDAKINELTQKENSILENHKALWEKVFNSIDKSTVKDATATNYGDFLANSLDKIKDKFTDDELKSLKEDVEEIKKLEDELQPLLEKQSANASNKDSGKEGASVFPEFKAKDLDGNDVDSSIISKNAVTVLNFWFNGCSPCVQELPELNKLNEELKEKGGQVIGINTDSLDGNEDGIAEAKSILEKQGAKYTNLSLDSNSEAGKYATSIMAFPTTIVLDRNGNIIGEPIMGGINTGLNNALTGMGNSSKVILGLVLGGMMAIDMGGPFNKAAYVFGTAAIAAGNYDIMAAVMVGGMTPPCAIALASLLFKDKFTKSEREAGPTNFIMGLAFITEGAIPYAAADPLHVLPACIAGSAAAGALSMAFGCTLMAPHGGIFVFPVVGNAIMYLVALVAGTVISAVLLLSLIHI